MTVPLEHLTETLPPESTADALTTIFTSLRLTGGTSVEARAAGAWSLESQFTDEDKAEFLPAGSELVGFHYVTAGRFFASVEGEPPVEVSPGTIVLVPGNDRHRMYTDPKLQPVDTHAVMEPATDESVGRIRIRGEGEESVFYCGFLGIASEHRWLLSSLPKLLTLNRDDALRSAWMESSMRLMELSRQSPEIVARLAELFFVEALHRYVERMPEAERGLFAGMQDPVIAKALNVIHNRYAEELDVELLAREAGVSRAVLGERFVDVLGVPPMRYCAQWRMRVAAGLLREGRQNTANVAYSVGFNSEAGFNRAFKREFGVPPATWRRQVEPA